jgi:hypothetical protein
MHVKEGRSRYRRHIRSGNGSSPRGDGYRHEDGHDRQHDGVHHYDDHQDHQDLDKKEVKFLGVLKIGATIQRAVLRET